MNHPFNMSDDEYAAYCIAQLKNPASMPVATPAKAAAPKSEPQDASEAADGAEEKTAGMSQAVKERLIAVKALMSIVGHATEDLRQEYDDIQALAVEEHEEDELYQDLLSELDEFVTNMEATEDLHEAIDDLENPAG